MTKDEAQVQTVFMRKIVEVSPSDLGIGSERFLYVDQIIYS
jgi:hypothetical protein